MHHDQCTNKIEKAKDAPAQRSVHRMARFSIIIPDALSATVKARAEEEEVSLAEVGRRALSAWCTADAPDTTAEYTAEIERCTTAHQAATTARDEAIALVERGKADLVRLGAESERLREDLVRATTTRDQFAERVERLEDERHRKTREKRERNRPFCGISAFRSGVCYAVVSIKYTSLYTLYCIANIRTTNTADHRSQRLPEGGKDEPPQMVRTSRNDNASRYRYPREVKIPRK